MEMVVDIETLGQFYDAAIVQIGCALFSVEKGVFETKVWNIDIGSAMQHGQVTPATLKWWLDQEAGARRSVFDGTLALPDAVKHFMDYVAEKNPRCFWAHATFDFPILAHACRQAGVKPLPYKKLRDQRTIEDLLPDIEWPVREGIHHHAGDDARFQAEVIVRIRRKAIELGQPCKLDNREKSGGEVQ